MKLNSDYIPAIKNKFEINKIKEIFDSLKHLKVLVLGDTILDQYVFVALKGRAIKDPILSSKYIKDEKYAGGILAIANHISSFVDEIKLVTLIGDKDPHLDLIQKSIKSNIDLKTFTKNDSPTTIKKRYIDSHRNNKLFKIEFMDDTPINNTLSNEIINYLNQEIPNYDLVVVGDFGHGFINKEIRRILEQKSKFLALNVQTNSSNFGFNHFKLYNKFDFITMNEQELRLPLSRRFEDIDDVIRETHQIFNHRKFLVTQGKKGCTFVNDGKFFKAPIVIESVKDTIGAGDALYAIAALLASQKVEKEIIPFIANCAGGILANVTGNKESLDKEKLLEFIAEVYKNGMGKL